MGLIDELLREKLQVTGRGIIQHETNEIPPLIDFLQAICDGGTGRNWANGPRWRWGYAGGICQLVKPFAESLPQI